MGEHAAIEIFNGIAEEIMEQRSWFSYSFNTFRAVDNPNLEHLRAKRAIANENMAAFFKDDMKKHRYHYKVYSRWPVSEGTANSIVNSMKSIFDNADL